LPRNSDHHPGWFNVYGVAVTPSTNDAGGLTERDSEFARAVDRQAAWAQPESIGVRAGRLRGNPGSAA
jgi:pterin-4a-carbinolamine dehydratase